MEYKDLVKLLKTGDVIQIAAPYISGVGKVAKLLEHTLVLDPYEEDDHEKDSVPATTVLPIEDIRMYFVLKPQT